MEKFHIGLTDEEAALVASIQLRVPTSADVRDVYLCNESNVPCLMGLLLGRRAIPDARLRYWSDPEYCTARGKLSYEQNFASNGSTGREAYQHLHFLPFLRYFLFGCELPDAAIELFETGLGLEGIKPESFTSGDHEPMWKLARKLTRKYGLVKRKQCAAEEFLKLCLDLGFDIHTARSVRDQVMRVR
ncbi:MAG: hypothetical protein F4X40_05190 [Chloroflexi bacterium]|nr:hypothetical protein [Chloroflexota bacterium]